MLTYTNIGPLNFQKRPVEPYQRGGWEFWVLLSGSITMIIGDEPVEDQAIRPTLWAFPRGFRFGCCGEGVADRAIFDFSEVPLELERMLPTSGYYRTRLSPFDCRRIREMAPIGRDIFRRPSPLCDLQQQAMVSDLSLLALRDEPLSPVLGSEKAHIKVCQALEIYTVHMSANPRIEAIAKKLHMSRAHLYRLFLQETGTTPKVAFHRLRMQQVEKLLVTTEHSIATIADMVGMSEASALTRAVKDHFGMSPRQLRKDRSAV